MSTELIDSHLHLWDLSSNQWYPAMQGTDASKPFESLGDVTRMARDFLVPELREELAAADAELLGVVHISAASAPRTHVDEARWLDGLLDELGVPAVTVGAFEATQSRAEMEADLDAQNQAGRLRGGRVLTGLDPDSAAAADLCALLEERHLVFDMVAQPSAATEFCALLERFPELDVALEHAGWPEATDAAAEAAWRDSLERFAALPNVSCKLSGLGMATHSLAAATLRPWIEGCLEAFGADRCLFGSNFPVEAMYGTYAELLASVHAVTDALPEAEQRALYVDNARRLYRL